MNGSIIAKPVLILAIVYVRLRSPVRKGRRQLSNLQRIEGRGRAFGVEAYASRGHGVVGVFDRRELDSVNVDGQFVPSAPDVDLVAPPRREAGGLGGGQVSLAGGGLVVFAAELPAVGLQRQVVKVLQVDEIPNDPADLPGV